MSNILKTFKKKIKNVGEVFEGIGTVNLKVNLKKCEFLQTDVKFLGHIISSDWSCPYLAFPEPNQ